MCILLVSLQASLSIIFCIWKYHDFDRYLSEVIDLADDDDAHYDENDADSEEPFLS